MLSSSAFWKTQHIMHGKDSNVLPGCLVILAGVLVMYRHLTSESMGQDVLKTFLALIMVQMLPLVLIEVKISSCPDPMSLLSRFGTKVLLMHACFLGLRVAGGFAWSTFLGFLGACVALHAAFGLRLTFRTIIEHSDVLGLLMLGALTAVIEHAITYMALQPFQREMRWKELSSVMIPDICNYIEILAFMPAVFMVWRDKGTTSTCPSANDFSIRRKANYFFAFLLAHYLFEDIGSIPSLWAQLPIAAAAHAAHFLLVLDFSGFMLAHIYSPEKVKEGIQKLTSKFGSGCLV